ncbi:tyrosine-type recombinase/integrase [Rothia sp. AR01]|uniref:Tyrosine-type recombinase/integrase n=1 Tax=Rothia santali TaxID=2949643 RepID=A0A9X2KIH4_9MICC|nr:tyrosine-type recombinase/integrase [Rothia santali]MCP3425844.1 tyrosine-type recombinase/integrase [Rothia santali]
MFKIIDKETPVQPMSWSTATTRFAHWLEAAGRTRGTITTRLWWINHLRQSLNDQPPTSIRPEQISAWLANPDWSPSTRKSALASARRFFHWMRVADARPDDPTEHLLNVTVPRRRARPTPDQVIHAALERATSTEDELMILLGAYAGLRRTEIATLSTEDRTDGWFTITGKGGVQRVIPIHEHLTPYLDLKTTGYYFPGRFTGSRHPDYVGRRLSKLLGPGYTSHQLRHWFATSAYAKLRDLRAVQELLGHADITTTQAYVAVDDTALLSAIASLPDLPHPRLQAIPRDSENITPQGGRA